MAKITARLRKWRDLFTSTRSDIDELRGRHLRLLEETERVRRAPMPAENIRARIDGILNDLEARARSKTIPTTFALPPTPGIANPARDHCFEREHLDLGMLIVLGAVDRDRIAAKLTADAMAAVPGPAMTAIERDAALAKLAAEIDDVEHVEESLIREGEAVGLQIQRREDANPAILLAVEV